VTGDELDDQADAFTTPSGRLPRGTVRLVSALDEVLATARAIERSNRAHATRADRTGHRLDAQKFRAVADAAFRLGGEVDRVRLLALDGAFT
jgi:hypothetical protein